MAVFIDGSPNDRDSLETALLFSRRFEARLTVVHPHVPEQIVLAAPEAAVVIDNLEASEEATQSARGAYDALCAGLDFVDWLECGDDSAEAIRRLGLYYDLTILERLALEEGPQVYAFNTALFETGGPVLVAPPSPPSVIGEVVAIVWNNTVQSARAVRSAIPVLKKAKQVSVLSNSANDEADPAKLVDYLACHGIAAESHGIDIGKLSARGRGRAILTELEALKADLLVMGAYGENRFTGIFGLGRTTQKVVTAAKIPLFMQR